MLLNCCFKIATITTRTEQHIRVTNLFPPANVTASHYRRWSGGWTVCDMRRARWGLYSRKVVNSGRWYCSIYRTYDLLSWTATQVCVRGGGRGRRVCGWATAPPSSLRCLSATTPPPCAATHGDPPGAGAWTDGRATYAAALTDRPIPILASIAQYPILITGIVRTLKATVSDK